MCKHLLRNPPARNTRPRLVVWRQHRRPTFLAIGLLASLICPHSCHGIAAGAQTEIYIRVNQIGYQPTDTKIAIAFARVPMPGKFKVIDAGSRQVVFEGNASALSGRWGQFQHHAELDFSAFKTPGRYHVSFGVSESPQFSISAAAYSDLPDQLLEFMRQQRCGYNPWLDAVCHSFDGRTAYGPLAAGTYLDATGGWHDAGDLLKYLLTSSNATAQILLAYQLQQAPSLKSRSLARAAWLGTPRRPRSQRPSASQTRIFPDSFNALGQPGANRIPDILDEARWGLDWMLKLHPAPDQLYHQVADDRDHKGWRLPQNETVDYGWGPGSYRVVYFADGRPQGLREYKSKSNGVANLAGRYAAAMALGYQIWKGDPRSADYAARLLLAGREVYALGKAREGVQQGNSYGAPYRYEETTWADDMEWGAAELFRATGERQYLQDAKRFAQTAGSESWLGQEQTGHYQYYPFMNLGHFRLYDLVDANFRKVVAGYYREGIERAVKLSEQNPYGVGVPFIWCSNNLTVALATQCALYESMTGDLRYHHFMSRQRDWLLGRNPWGVSMFTMIPENGVFPKDVHLMPNSILKRQVRGGLVDGPVYKRIFQSLKGVSITEPDPFAAFQDDRAVYHDDIKDYATNEPTMDGTASAILLWAVQKERGNH
jgi:endoglucanase